MKAVMILVSALFTVGFSAQAKSLSAESLTIQNSAKALGILAMGSKSFKVSGQTERQMLIKHLGKKYNDPTTLVNKEIEKIAAIGELNYGTTSMNSAIQMKDFAVGELLAEQNTLEHNEGSEAEINAVIAKRESLDANWEDAVKLTENTKVIFGYSGYGPESCDDPTTMLIMIDVKGQRLHEIYFLGKDHCQ